MISFRPSRIHLIRRAALFARPLFQSRRSRLMSCWSLIPVGAVSAKVFAVGLGLRGVGSALFAIAGKLSLGDGNRSSQLLFC